MFTRTKITVKVIKSEPNILCSHETLDLNNSSKKLKFQKNLFNFEFYAGGAFECYHSHFSMMNVAVGQNCRNKKKTI